MVTKSSITKKVSNLDKTVAEATAEKKLKVFVVRSKEEELNIYNEFKDKEDVNAVLIRCY
ncbi:hypothetical protein GAMM_200041 [Gammaproteobacteria bacterium]